MQLCMNDNCENAVAASSTRKRDAVSWRRTHGVDEQQKVFAPGL